CVSVATGNEALILVTEKGMRPDLVVSDYNLPGMSGVETIQALRAAITWKIPAIVLTGDIRSHAIEAIAQHDVGVLVKPTDAAELRQLIRQLQPHEKPPPVPRPRGPPRNRGGIWPSFAVTAGTFISIAGTCGATAVISAIRAEDQARFSSL